MLKEAMHIRFKDIIDLDYLVGLDETVDSEEKMKKRSRRDRDIFNKCRKKNTGEKELLMQWLFHRKNAFEHERQPQAISILPGDLFSMLYHWMAVGLSVMGFVAGISLAYSFLAYHGAFPVNVTVFISFFILFQVFLIILTLLWFLKQRFFPAISPFAGQHSIIHLIFSHVIFNWLPGVLQRLKHPIFHKSLDTMTYTAALIHLKQKEYQNIFFWLFFVLSSIFALCFSLGVLGATFFRVVTSDLAFGWQSTLFAGDDTIYRIVATMAKPWSWFVSDSIAHPTLDQIEGTRMILKEGMISLATKDLVSWWPFLCFGILFYAVLPRMILIGAGVAAQRNAVANFDIHAPRFKQLLLRMKNPFLDISSEEDEDLENRVDNRKYRQSFELNKPLKMKENLTAHQLEKALILASPVVYPVDCMAGIENKIKKDLGFTIEKTIPIDFDLNRDVQALTDAKIHCPAHVVLLQEVWQPPIRERLHYLKEVKNTYFADQTLWIFLTQNPMEKSLGVNGEDMNFKVWKKAVTLLENSGIAVQRCRP